MPKKKLSAAFIVMALFVGAMFYTTHTFAEHQAYRTGVYIGKAAFSAANYQNRVCSRPDATQPGCEVRDLNQDSVMENALASANIIPSLVDSAPLHTGFRDGWREARMTASPNR